MGNALRFESEMYGSYTSAVVMVMKCKSHYIIACTIQRNLPS